MGTITLKGNSYKTIGELPKTGSKAPNFSLRTIDLNNITLDDFENKKIILNIFPSIDTGTCAASVRNFNKIASELQNTKIICVSRDLPFAHARFCGAEGIENIITASDISGNFSSDYGLQIIEGPLEGLTSRSIIILDENRKVIYTQQVEETVDEPNYEQALKVLK
jgi:thiol peroxidase